MADIRDALNFFEQYAEERAHLNHFEPLSDSARWENPLASAFNANCYGFACDIGLDIEPGARGIANNTGYSPKWRDDYQIALDYRTVYRADPDPSSFRRYCNSVFAGLQLDEAVFGLTRYEPAIAQHFFFSGRPVL